MESIKEILKDQERTIFLKGADSLTRGHYTQVPNVLLTHQEISPGAKLAYSMLLKYDWYYNGCFPGQQRLAKDMGVGERSVSRFIKELEKWKFIEVKRRGLGKTNLYFLNCKITPK